MPSLIYWLTTLNVISTPTAACTVAGFVDFILALFRDNFTVDFPYLGLPTT